MESIVSLLYLVSINDIRVLVYLVSILNRPLEALQRNAIEWRFAGEPIVARDCMLAGLAKNQLIRIYKHLPVQQRR